MSNQKIEALERITRKQIGIIDAQVDIISLIVTQVRALHAISTILLRRLSELERETVREDIAYLFADQPGSDAAAKAADDLVCEIVATDMGAKISAGTALQ